MWHIICPSLGIVFCAGLAPMIAVLAHRIVVLGNLACCGVVAGARNTRFLRLVERSISKMAA